MFLLQQTTDNIAQRERERQPQQQQKHTENLYEWQLKPTRRWRQCGRSESEGVGGVCLEIHTKWSTWSLTVERHKHKCQKDKPHSPSLYQIVARAKLHAHIRKPRINAYQFNWTKLKDILKMEWARDFCAKGIYKCWQHKMNVQQYK